jgi:site-specific recombinase
VNQGCRRKGKSRPLLPAPALAELANSETPLVELEPYLKRLRAAGVIEVHVAMQTRHGALVDTTAELARREPSAIVAQTRRFVATQELDWTGSGPVAEALERLTKMVQRFDKLTRFWLAASDMRLAADTAAALVDAREHHGSARMFDRALETSLVVTFVRPYLESNEAGLGRTWWPTDEADRALFDELREHGDALGR